MPCAPVGCTCAWSPDAGRWRSCGSRTSTGRAPGRPDERPVDPKPQQETHGDHVPAHDRLHRPAVPGAVLDDGASISDPEGRGPKLYFQRVPEPKTVKNRLHLDLDIVVASDPIVV
ncbi:MAG: VOC family protein [Dermatophilaceae bacterium]